MNTAVIIITVALGLLALEGVFFLYCFKWLSGGKRLREKEFARLDAERGELLELQAALSSDLTAARQMSQETLARLNRIGADAHAEWTEMTARIEAIMAEIETRTKSMMTENLGVLSKQRLTLEKVCKESLDVSGRLEETLGRAQRILRFFDKNIPTEQIVKELQAEKYAEARKLVEQGVEASAVARKLGMSVSEVALLSTLR